MENIHLKNILDKQEVLLMKLAYLDIDIEKYEELKFEGNEITVSDLSNLLINPNNSYLGLTEEQIESCLGNIKIDTQEEVIKELKENGLGDLKVRDMASDPQINFKAIAFEDDFRNIGMTFSGTDFNTMAMDEDSNLPTHLVENEEQIEAAQIFFKANKTPGCSHHLYGHSLGGNLATNLYIENLNDIDSTYVVNALPVKKEKVKDATILKALSDSERYDNVVIGGDCASQLEDQSDYWFNITYVQNNDKLNNNLLANHLLECATYEWDENYITTSKCEAYRGHKYKSDKEPEEIDSQNKYNDFEEKYKDFGTNKFLEKITELSKSTAQRIKSFVMRILKKNPKELPSGTEQKQEDVGQARKDFVSQHQLSAYVEEGKYTKEQATRAQEISDNPLKFINKEETFDNDKKEVTNDNIIE